MSEIKFSRRSFITGMATTAAIPVGFKLINKSSWAETNNENTTGLPFGADKVVHTRCGQGDVCGVYHMASAYVKDGQIVAYEGCKEAFNKGSLCPRGASGLQFIYSPHRVKYPMKNVGGRGSGQWERISWDEAYDMMASKIAEAIKEEGPHTVGLHYGHLMSKTTQIIGARFRKIWGISSVPAPGVCWNNLRFGAWPTLGDYNHLKEEDFHHSRLIVLWGHNAALAMPTEWRDGMMKAKEEFGAKIVVIDPYYTASAEKADLFIQIRTGTDAAFALGVANVLITEDLLDHNFIADHTVGFDEYKELALQYTPEKVEEITWAPAEQIREFARMYATIKPAVLEVGRGVNYAAGNAGWLGVRGLTCLIGLTGQVGIRGAGYSVEASTGNPSFTSFWNDWPFNPLTNDVEQVVPSTGKAAANAWEGQKVLYHGDPYRYRVIITPSDIAAKFPDQNSVEEGLSQIPFIVIESRFINHTAAKFADLVLPNALWTEQAMLHAEYTHMVCSPPVIEPMFEAKPTFLILAELNDHLCEKLGIEQPVETFMPYRTDEQIINALLTNSNLPKGGYPNLTYQELSTLPAGIRGTRPYNQEGYVFYREDGDPNKPFQFYTPSGKLEFKSQTLEDKFGLPSLPVHEEPTESPISTPELLNEYPLVVHCRVHRHWGFLQYNLIEDGGPASPITREIFSQAKQPTVELNPATAEQYGLKEGDMVYVESKYGKLEGVLHLTQRCHPKMVVTPYYWGSVQNRLTPPEISLFPGITIEGVGPYGTGKSMKNQGGQSTYAGFLGKVYKA